MLTNVVPTGNVLRDEAFEDVPMDVHVQVDASSGLWMPLV